MSEDFNKLHRRIELALEENSEQRKEIAQLTEQMKLLNQRLKIVSQTQSSVRNDLHEYSHRGDHCTERQFF